MANCANSTSTPAASRRRLGAGLLAIMAGSVITSGIAAGAAASVGDLLPSDPDADLIALCTRFDALERRRQQACNSARTTEQEAASDLVWAEVEKQQTPMLNQMCSMPCTTLAGLGALAASLALWDAELFIEEDDVFAPANERLTAALVRASLAARASA